MAPASSPPPSTPASSAISMPRTPTQIKTEQFSTPLASDEPSPLLELKMESSPPSELNNRFRSVVKSYLPGRPDLTSESSLQAQLKTESSSPPEFNKRFHSVIDSHLPGRPDLTSNSPLPASSSSFSTNPVSITPTKTSVKQEERSTPATSTDNTSSGLDAESSILSRADPIKPSHLAHLTDAEYRARLAQVKVTRERLMPTMKKSLQLTQEWAAKRRKQEERRDGPYGHGGSHGGKDEKLKEVSTSINEVQNLLGSISLELDRRVSSDGVQGGSAKRNSHAMKQSKEAVDDAHVTNAKFDIVKANEMLAKTQAMVAALQLG